MTDHVYEDTVRSYEFSSRLADELIDSGWNAITSKIDTRMPETPVVVFNTLGFQRSDLAEVEIGFSQPGLRGIGVTDDAGKDVPFQVQQATYYEDGCLKTARIAFLARDIPARGLSHLPAWQARSGSEGHQFQSIRVAIPSRRPDTGSLSTVPPARSRVCVSNPRTGRSSRARLASCRGSKIEAISGSCTAGLDGGSKIAMTTRQDVPKAGQARFSNEFKGDSGTLTTGPVYSEFRVAHPFDSGKFEETIRMYADLRRIECRIRLVNNEKYVRYQALLPTTIKNGKSVHEIPFGAIERPSGIEFPAQNWVDYGDGQRGLAVLNFGLPGNVVTDGTMMVSLLRAHTLGAYGFGGGYEPGMSSDSGFQLGKERTMRFALLPHSRDWSDAGVVQESRQFLDPLITRVVAPHEGPLPSRWGLLNLDADNVQLSDLKPARGGGIILRVYETAGKAASQKRLALHAGVSSAREINLLEDPGRALEVEDGGIRLDLHPFEIKTFLFQLAPATAR